MLVRGEEESEGTIGGGSLEYQSSERAKEMQMGKSPEILEFNLNNSHLDESRGVCGGSVKVLIEPIGQDLIKICASASELSESDTPHFLVLQLKEAEQLETKRRLVSLEELLTLLPPEIKLKSGSMSPEAHRYTSGDTQWIVYPISSGPRLHIFGAGHVGQSIADLSRKLDLETAVYDDREMLLTEERFPGVERVILPEIEDWTNLPIRSQDFVIIASREHRHDRKLLEMILKTPPAYVGLLASKRKWILMREKMAADGTPQSLLDQVHSPVGLAINAQTVPEIAISILGEVIAKYREMR